MKGFDPAIVGQEEKDEVVGKIKNDLQDFFKFINLLKKKRSKKNTMRIDDYIKRESAIAKRIKFIEELDKKEKLDEDISKFKGKSSQDSQQKSRAKYKLNKNSYLTFIFTTRKLLLQFARKTSVISSGFFSLSFKITADSRERYRVTLNDAATHILTPMYYILEHGWKTLNPVKYNLVSGFSKFIKQFTQLGDIFDVDDIAILEQRIESFIESYLQIVGIGDNKEQLKKIFHNALNEIPSYKEKLKDILVFLDDITKIDSPGINFSNVILGIYALRYKKIIRIKELTEHYKIQNVDDLRYDFSPKVLQKIKQHLETLENKYKQAEEGLFYLRFAEENFNFKYADNNALTDLFSKVYYFVQLSRSRSFGQLKIDQKIEKLNFIESSLENLSPLFIQFLSGFVRIYGKLLFGKVTVQLHEENKQVIDIFRDSIFMNEITRLLEVQGELGNLKSRGGVAISLDVYDHFVETGKTQLEREKRLCTLYKITIHTFYNISTKISKILYNNSLAQKLTGEDKLTLTTSQNKPLQDIPDEPVLLPFSTHHLLNNPYLEGYIVIRALNEVMAFTINFCQLFNYKPLMDRIGMKKRFIDMTDDYIHMSAKME